MADEKIAKENEETPKGAVEVDEEKLDEAEGGISLNYSKIEVEYKTQVDPSIGQATFISPEKKI